MFKILTAVVGIVFVYSYAKSKNVNLSSQVLRQVPGMPTRSGTVGTHFPVATSATAQDLNASSSLLTAATGFLKIFNPAPTVPAVIDIRGNTGSVPAPTPSSAYGTVTPPNPFQLPPNSWNGVAPPVFTGAPVMPNLQPTNDAGVATGTANSFVPPVNGASTAFDGAGSLGYGTGNNSDELNAFGLDNYGLTPSPDPTLSAVDTNTTYDMALG